MGIEFALLHELLDFLQINLIWGLLFGVFNDLEFNFDIFRKLRQQLLDMKWLKLIRSSLSQFLLAHILEQRVL
jgi:hypothetical protein